MTQPQQQWAIFALDDRWFGVPVAAVVRVAPRVAVTPLAQLAPLVEGVVQFGGRSLAVIDLRQRLGLPPRPPRLSDRLLILQIDDQRAALHVTLLAGVIALDGPSARGDRGHALTQEAQASGLVTPQDGTVLALDLASLLPGELWRAWSLAGLGGGSATQRD